MAPSGIPIPVTRCRGCAPDSQPDAKLAGSPAHCKCQHAGDTNQGDGQRHGCETAEDQCIQPVRRKHFRADVFESGGAFHHLLGGHIANNARDGRHQPIRVRARVHEQATTPELLLREGMVHGYGRRWNYMLVVDIRRHPDDTARLGADIDKFDHRIGPHNVAVHGVLGARKHAPCQALAHHHHRFFALCIGIVEIAGPR